MDTSNSTEIRTESALAVASMFAVGLGIITTVLFPFLIPGIAILALLAIPLIPLMVVVPILAGAFLAVRGLVRLISRRARTSPAPAAAWGRPTDRSQ